MTAALTLSFVKEHYEAGVPADIISPIDPATYNFDYLQNIAPIKKREIMLDLLYDYGTNVVALSSVPEILPRDTGPAPSCVGQE